MKKTVITYFIGSLVFLTVLGCATAGEQEKVIPSRGEETSSRESSAKLEAKKDTLINQGAESNAPSIMTLIFTVSSCSWSYRDENGELQAVSITDGKPKYVKSGKIHYINVMDAELEFQ